MLPIEQVCTVKNLNLVWDHLRENHHSPLKSVKIRSVGKGGEKWGTLVSKGSLKSGDLEMGF